MEVDDKPRVAVAEASLGHGHDVRCACATEADDFAKSDTNLSRFTPGLFPTHPADAADVVM